MPADAKQSRSLSGDDHSSVQRRPKRRDKEPGPNSAAAHGAAGRLSLVGVHSLGRPRVPGGRRLVREVGLALVTAGFVVLLFVVYELVGTNLSEEHSQAQLARDFNAAVAAPARPGRRPRPVPAGPSRPEAAPGQKGLHRTEGAPVARPGDEHRARQAAPPRRAAAPRKEPEERRRRRPSPARYRRRAELSTIW